MNKPIKINEHLIGSQYPPFIVAEMSGNHNQSLESAFKIVEAAAMAGVHAVKLQTYTADTITIDADSSDFFIDDPESLWKGQSLYKLYQQAYTPWEWHGPIFKRCQELGIIAFSTPFDETAVDFLESLNVPAYKIASFENNHLPLIKKVASTGKPLIISTGMATDIEIQEAIQTAQNAGCRDIILLKCTSTYPATPENTNLMTIPDMKERFRVHVGISDHTLSIGVSIAAVALGAVIIEKHLTVARLEGGVDAAFSLEPMEMKSLVEETEKAWQALGRVHYGPVDEEKPSLRFRRSIYIVKNIKKGQKFTSENIRIIRPGLGMHPRYYEETLGQKAACNIKKGMPLNREFIDKDQHTS
ncbi:MAG: pseudaminic acid synthase [Proteobacteria bacterium]|nr:pseudaminic acid synthase [Pseudomonadota bacterium]